MNIDCRGKPFHCLNSTHFMICVDFGAGISKTVDEFVIGCPSTTVCRRNNRFECEYELPTTTESTIGLGDETNNFELNEQLTTISPFRETSDTRLLLSKYLNTVSVTTQTDFVTDKQIQNPGTTVKITDISSNNMTISLTGAKYLNNSDVRSETYAEEKLLKPSLIPFQNTSDLVPLLKEIKDKESIQDYTIMQFPEKPINLINGTSTLHILGINNEAKKLNKTDIFMKLSDTTLYDKKTVSESSAFTTLDSQNVLNSSNIVNTEILNSFNDLTSPTTVEILNKGNAIKESTTKSMKSSSNDFTNTENLLMQQATTIKTTLIENAYPTLKRNVDFEETDLRIENSKRANERVSELKTQNKLTERTVANTTEDVTTMSYNENILNGTLLDASLTTNDTTTLSNENLVFGNTSTTLKPVINSITDDRTRSMKATGHINEIEVTSTIPYLLTKVQITKEEMKEKSEGQSTTLIEDRTLFTQDQIPVEMISATDTVDKITKNNTKVELLQQTTRFPNNLMNMRDNNSFKDVITISTSVHDKEKLLSGENINVMSGAAQLLTTIFSTTDNYKMEIRNVPQETKASENVNTNTLSQNQIDIAIAAIEDLNLFNTDILTKTNLSKFEPNFVTANSASDSITPFNIKQEDNPVTNDVNENIISVKSQSSVQKMGNLGSDISKINRNLTRTSLNTSYTTESEQIPIVEIIYQSSLSIDTSPTNNNTTTLSNDNLIFGHTLTTIRPVIKSTRDDTRSVKATERINEIEVTSSTPYLIAKAQLTQEVITERLGAQSATLTEDETFLMQDQVNVKLNSAKETFSKIPKSYTKGELIQQATILPNNFMDVKDNNYNSFKDKIPIYDLDKEKLYMMSIGSELLTTIFPTPDNFKMEITNIPEESKASENNNINTLSKAQTGIAGIDSLNFHSTDSLAKVNLSKFKPNLVSANSAVTDNVTPVNSNPEINSFTNDVDEDMILVINKNSVQNFNMSTTDKSNMNINFPKTSVTESFTIKSDQLATEPTRHQNSTSIDAMNSPLKNIVVSNNIKTIHDKIPAEMSTTEIYHFFKSKSSTILSSEPIVTTVNNNAGKTNNENNEKLESFKSALTINDHYRTAGVPVKNNYFISTSAPTSIYPSKSFGTSADLLSNVKENFTTRDIVRFNRKLQGNVTMHEYYDKHKDPVKISKVDSNTYIPKNLLQANANFADPTNVTTLLNKLPNNQLFSNISDKISTNNFTSENISYGGKTDLYTKGYKPEPSTYQNELKVTTDTKTLANFEIFTNKVDDGYATYTKYDLPSTTANERLQDIFTTDLSINVDNANILEESDIFKYKPLSGSTKADHIHIKNNVIEKPLILSSTEQPLEDKDNIRNVIPDVYSTSTIKAAQLDGVQPNFVSDEPMKEIADTHENMNYDNYDISRTNTIAETKNLVDVLSTKIYPKSTKISNIESTYATNISVTKNVDDNLNTNKMPYLSSVTLKNKISKEEFKNVELQVNNTKIDYLLQELTQNATEVALKILTDKYNLPNTLVNEMISTSDTNKAPSIRMSNSYIQISNNFPVTDIPTSMSLKGGDDILMHKLKKNSMVKDLDKNNTDHTYRGLNNDGKIALSNQTTILENNDTSSFSAGVKVDNFKTISTAGPSTINVSFIRQVSFESSTPKLKEDVQLATIYTDVATPYSQKLIEDTGNTNVKNKNDHNMNPYDNLKANFTDYNLTNNETKITTTQESIKKEQSLNVQRPILSQNFKLNNKFSLRSPDTVTNFELKNIQTRNTEAPSFGNITDKGKNIFDINAKDVLQNANKSHGHLSKHITAIEVSYGFTAEITEKSLRDKKEAKVYANNVQFSCRNRFRDRYANKHDCRKFYICIGKNQPILGECPINTVFSEIKKQCTKNLSHCLINNQFLCIQEGRFSDILKNDIYYICVKNKNTYIRFQFQCQGGYHLNKTTIRCVSDKQIQSEISSMSVDNESNKASDQSTVERKSKETKQTELVEKKLCKDEGKFWDPDDCRRYYICTKNSKSVFRRRTKKCDSDEVFHREKKKCVKDDSYECG